jgi:hypothetical protein
VYFWQAFIVCIQNIPRITSEKNKLKMQHKNPMKFDSINFRPQFHSRAKIATREKSSISRYTGSYTRQYSLPAKWMGAERAVIYLTRPHSPIINTLAHARKQAGEGASDGVSELMLS